MQYKFLQQMWVLHLVFFRRFYKTLLTNLILYLLKYVTIHKYSTDYYGSLDKYTEKVICMIQSKYVKTFETVFTVEITSSDRMLW